MKVIGGSSSSSSGARMSLSITVLIFFTIGSAPHVHGVPLGETSTNGSSSTAVTAPDSSVAELIFPTDASRYRIIENDTVLKVLQERAALDTTPEPSPVGKEVTEGQNVLRQQSPTVGTDGTDESDSGSSNNGTTKSSALSSYDDDGDDYSNENDDNDDDTDDYSTEDAEDVQPEDRNREDGLEEQFGNRKDNHYPMVIDDTVIEVSAMRKEHVWVIMVGAIIVLSLAAYIGMILYRNRLEQRYGMRQRLVTEDDYYTNNDI